LYWPKILYLSLIVVSNYIGSSITILPVRHNDKTSRSSHYINYPVYRVGQRTITRLVCLSYTCVFGETKRTKRIRINNKSCMKALSLSLSLCLSLHSLLLYLSIYRCHRPRETFARRPYDRCTRAKTVVINDRVLGHEWLMIPTRVNAQLAWIDHSSWRASCLPCVDVSMRINALTIRRARARVCVAGPQTDTNKRQIYIWMDTSGDEAYDILLWTWTHPLLGISKC